MSEPTQVKEAEVIYNDEDGNLEEPQRNIFVKTSKIVRMPPLLAVLVFPLLATVILGFLILFSIIIIPFLIKNRKWFKAQGVHFKNLAWMMRRSR